MRDNVSWRSAGRDSGRLLAVHFCAALSRDGQEPGVQVVPCGISGPRVIHHRPKDQRPSGASRSDVPGYEPFLLCVFDVHTRWSDGAPQPSRHDRFVRADGQVRRDRNHRPHPDEKGSLGARGPPGHPGQRRFGIPEDQFGAYLEISGAKRSAHDASTTCSWCRAPRSPRTS